MSTLPQLPSKRLKEKKKEAPISIDIQTNPVHYGNYQPLTESQKNSNRAKRAETTTLHWLRQYNFEELEVGIIDFILAYHGVNLVFPKNAPLFHVRKCTLHKTQKTKKTSVSMG